MLKRIVSILALLVLGLLPQTATDDARAQAPEVIRMLESAFPSDEQKAYGFSYNASQNAFLCKALVSANVGAIVGLAQSDETMRTQWRTLCLAVMDVNRSMLRQVRSIPGYGETDVNMVLCTFADPDSAYLVGHNATLLQDTVTSALAEGTSTAQP